MNRRWLPVLMLLASPSLASAAGVDGKWGIGAGFNSGSGAEISLMRGLSDRSLLGLDFIVVSQSMDLDVAFPPAAGTPVKQDIINWIVGPRFRHFTRATEGLAPSFDLFLQGIYFRNSETANNTTQLEYGARTGLGFGVEYFTPWSFSIAASSDLVEVTWTHVEQNAGFLFNPYTADGSRLQVRGGLAPALFVRAYF